jgi:hypothetical protein
MPIVHHDYLIKIKENSLLWRYMNLEKYYSLIESNCLFFCRADKFSDPFEFTLPKKEVEHRNNYLRKLFQISKEGPDYHIHVATDHNLRVKKGNVVNCWHINDNESNLMWAKYLKTNEGVAIQTSIQRMYNSLKNTQELINPSKVRYIDYERDGFFHLTEYPVNHQNTITPAIHKMKEYEFESEFRLLIEINDAIYDSAGNYWEKQQNLLGKFIKVDVKELVEFVIFHPTLEEEQKENIKRKTKALGYDFQFKNSSLDRKPDF